MHRVVMKYLCVKPEEIAYFQFLLEGYEGIGTLTTLEPEIGMVRFSIPDGCLADAEEVLRLVGQEIAVKEVPLDFVIAQGKRRRDDQSETGWFTKYFRGHGGTPRK